VTTWHLLTPEFPPRCGGVGDYTALVASGLADAGDEVHVWHPGPTEAPGDRPARLTVHHLPDRFGRGARRLLDDALRRWPGVVVAQYVPGAFGMRGLNVPFCRWMARLRRRGVDVRVMFHEPFFYFGWSRPWRNVLAAGQRLMAAILLRGSTRVYYSTATWRRLLAPYGPQSAVEVLPIPATIPEQVSAAALETARGARRADFVIGHFGTYGDHVARQLDAALPSLLRRLPAAHALLAGGGSDAYLRSLPADVAGRIAATGRVSGIEAAARLRACDLLLQPYPDGVTTRRTSVMCGLSTGVPVLTTSGALTEPLWSDSSAVALAPADDTAALVDLAVRLAGDPVERRALGGRGRALYDAQFALGLTIGRMRR
jgi:glycosyltransferase involved in cell wall biosynthesis